MHRFGRFRYFSENCPKVGDEIFEVGKNVRTESNVNVEKDYIVVSDFVKVTIKDSQLLLRLIYFSKLEV